MILQDTDVESVSSFIGIDGTNSTLNSGRIQINLKDRERALDVRCEVIQRLEPKVATGGGDPVLSAAAAGSDGGRPREPHAVPVFAGGRERRRAGDVDQPAGRKTEDDSDSERRGERSAAGRAWRLTW